MTSDERMTEEALAAIEARAAAATQGPWEVDVAYLGNRESVHYALRTRDRLPEHPWSPAFLLWACGALGHPSWQRWLEWQQRVPGMVEPYRRDERIEADMRFLAAARTDVPALVAEVRRLRSEVARAEGQAEASEVSRARWERMAVRLERERDAAAGTSRMRGAREREVAAMRAALETARHALATLHGLVAHDGAAPGETFPIDESAALATLDAVLGPAPGSAA